MRPHLYTVEQLEEAIKSSTSFREVSRKLGIKQSGSINQRIRDAGYDISHFTRSKPGSTKFSGMIGKKYGRLFIDNIIHKNNDIRPMYYALCTCECGVKKEIPATYISRKITNSCGCIRKDMYPLHKGMKSKIWKGIGEISGTFFSTLKRRAKSRNLEFNLSKSFLWRLFIEQDRKCALSGLVLYFSSSDNQSERTASLDRKDSKKGYTEDNVWWVHKGVNSIKHTMSINDFLLTCKLIYNHNKATCDSIECANNFNVDENFFQR